MLKNKLPTVPRSPKDTLPFLGFQQGKKCGPGQLTAWTEKKRLIGRSFSVNHSFKFMGPYSRIRPAELTYHSARTN